MRTFLFSVVLLALAVHASASYEPCPVGTYTRNISSKVGTSFGCDGYNGNAATTVTFNIGDGAKPVAFRLISIGLEKNRDYLKFVQGGTTVYGPFTGQSAEVGEMVCAPGLCTFIFTTDASVNGTGFQLEIVPPPPVVSTIAGREVVIKTIDKNGGFLYVGTPLYPLGYTSRYEVTVISYEGLQPPSVFSSTDYFSTLDVFDYQNETIPDKNGNYVSTVTNTKPKSTGTNYLSIFLYGNAATVIVKAFWEYDSSKLHCLTKDVVLEATSSSSPVFYCLKTTEDSSFFKLQVSRKQPGGYPMFYIKQGVPPNEVDYDYTLDTKVQNFYSLQSNEPYNGNVPNAGIWIIRVESKTQAGYLIKADWD